MKWVWLILGLLIVGAVVVLWQESSPRVAPSGAPAEAPSLRDRSPVRAAGDSGAAVAPRPVGAGAGTGTAAATSASSAGDASPTPAAASGASPSSGEPRPPLPKIANAEVSAGSFERLESGVLVADRRFRILGSGTQSDPYQVSWECLASAQESYVPRLGETVIPERIAMLDGKWVRMEGYVTFPLLMKEAKELILMLNQWDGCCIGVPPTPYDAIEVKLAEAVSNTRRHASFTFGSVTGRFKVEPFLVENWLVGLYVMEDAVFEPGEL